VSSSVMISLVDMRPAWRRPAGAYQRRLPLRHKRLAEIIDLAKNLDDPIQHHRLVRWVLQTGASYPSCGRGAGSPVIALASKPETEISAPLPHALLIRYPGADHA
jgi:hypothetical protein